MPKTYSFTKQQVKEIEVALKNVPTIKAYRRIEVLHLRAQGKSNEEIAEITNYRRSYVSELVSKYQRCGMSATIGTKRPGNHRKMTSDEEKEFLKPFIEKAQSGQILTITDLRNALDKQLNQKSAYSTIYNLLHRNGWRKIKPRSQHPKKASEEDIKAYKKNN